MQLSHGCNRRLAVLLTAGALSAGAVAAPAASAGPVITGGLVTVTIVDAVDINNNTVQLPIGIAANVCDVNANVLAIQQRNGGARCVATADAVANAPGRP
jgi:hypothetical protein